MLGINAKLYYNSTSYGSPTWVEVNLLADCQMNFSWDEGAADDRSDPAHRMVKTQFSLEVTGNLKKKNGNTAAEYMLDLAISRAAGDFLVLDGPRTTVGQRGFRFDGQVLGASEDQALGNVIYSAIVVKPTDSDNLVKAVKVGAGPALTFATVGGDSTSFA